MNMKKMKKRTKMNHKKNKLNKRKKRENNKKRRRNKKKKVKISMLSFGSLSERTSNWVLSKMQAIEVN